jgi:hypothetical protein
MGKKTVLNLQESVHLLANKHSLLIFIGSAGKERIDKFLKTEKLSPKARKMFERLALDFEAVSLAGKQSFDLLFDIKKEVYSRIDAEKVKVEVEDENQ